MKDKNTSERLCAWITDLGLYEEFLASLKERGYPCEISTQAVPHVLAIEFLKEHMRGLEETISIWKEQAAERFGEYRSAPALREIDKKTGANVADSMAAFCEHTARMRAEAQDYAQGARERADKFVKPTDPWGETTDTRGYPEK